MESPVQFSRRLICTQHPNNQITLAGLFEKFLLRDYTFIQSGKIHKVHQCFALDRAAMHLDVVRGGQKTDFGNRTVDQRIDERRLAAAHLANQSDPQGLHGHGHAFLVRFGNETRAQFGLFHIEMAAVKVDGHGCHLLQQCLLDAVQHLAAQAVRQSIQYPRTGFGQESSTSWIEQSQYPIDLP